MEGSAWVETTSASTGESTKEAKSESVSRTDGESTEEAGSDTKWGRFVLK